MSATCSKADEHRLAVGGGGQVARVDGGLALVVQGAAVEEGLRQAGGQAPEAAGGGEQLRAVGAGQAEASAQGEVGQHRRRRHADLRVRAVQLRLCRQDVRPLPDQLRRQGQGYFARQGEVGEREGGLLPVRGRAAQPARRASPGSRRSSGASGGRVASVLASWSPASTPWRRGRCRLRPGCAVMRQLLLSKAAAAPRWPAIWSRYAGLGDDRVHHVARQHQVGAEQRVALRLDLARRGPPPAAARRPRCRGCS